MDGAWRGMGARHPSDVQRDGTGQECPASSAVRLYPDQRTNVPGSDTESPRTDTERYATEQGAGQSAKSRATLQYGGRFQSSSEAGQQACRNRAAVSVLRPFETHFQTVAVSVGKVPIMLEAPDYNARGDPDARSK